MPSRRGLCSTELVEEKIEEFLAHFGEGLSRLGEDAFGAQVRALVELKESEDAHLGEEVDRHWFEVVTQQYVFRRLEEEVRVRVRVRVEVLERLWTRQEVPVQVCGSGALWSRQVKALKLFTRADLLSWFLEQRNGSRKLSVHVRALTWSEGPAAAGVHLCLCGGAGGRLWGEGGPPGGGERPRSRLR